MIGAVFSHCGADLYLRTDVFPQGSVSCCHKSASADDGTYHKTAARIRRELRKRQTAQNCQ